MKTFRRISYVIGLVSCGAGALAQTVDSTRLLNEVVVTAQKREETVGKVPMAVAALTSRQVQEFRLWNNKDLSGVVPALYAADPGDGRDVISIRGITSTSYDPAVAVYVDGINQFGLDTYLPSLFDVQRIEVLRGPQGTLYGRNAMGGVMNIITRQPGNAISGSVEAGAGSFGQQRYSASLRIPLVKNRLFVGAAGLYDGRNGYYTNQYDGSSYDKQHAYTGNYYLKFLPGNQWSLELNVKHRGNRNHGAFPLVADATTAFKEAYQVNQNAKTTMVDNTFQSSLAANHRGSRVHFKSQTSYQQNYRYYVNPIDGDFSRYDIISIVNNYGKRWNNIRAYTQDFQFASSGAGKLQWTAGAYGFYQDQPNKQATRYGMDANMYMVGDSLFSTIASTKSHKWGMAYYGQINCAVTSKMHLTAGLRYDYERQTQHVMGEYQHDPDPTAIVTVPDTAGRVSFHALSPRVALDLQASKHSNVYVVYSRGFRTGGLTQLSFMPGQPPLVGYRPEHSSNYEAGVKNSFAGGTIRLNADLFYTHINDAQVPTLILPDAITVTRNTGRLNNWGAEAEMAASILKGLDILYNFGYTHSKFERLKLASNGAEVDLAGKRQLFTPDITSMLAIQYNEQLGRGLRGFVRGEWKMTGTTWFDLANTIRQSSYSIFNLRCGLDVSRFELAVWGRNIGDKKYISYAYDFGAYHLGDPATWGVTLALKFGE